MRREGISIADLYAALIEGVIRDMLGKWVSELEPVIVRDKYDRPIGLTAEGHFKIYIPSPLGDFSETYTHARRAR